MSESEYHVYTLLEPEDVKRLGGIPPKAIVGFVDLEKAREAPGRFTPEIFTPNRAFRDFLHEVLAECATRSEGVRAEAERLGDGHVYLIDGRTPTPDGQVPMADIIGAIEAHQGEVVPGSYWANPEHRIVSEDGLFQLARELEECLLNAMRSLPGRPTQEGE